VSSSNRRLPRLPCWSSLFLFAVLASDPARAQDPAGRCGACHGDSARQMSLSVHARPDIDCTTCHGGDPAASTKEAAHSDATRMRISPRASVELCSGCHSDRQRMHRFGLHTDQLEQYRTSVHGKKLLDENNPDVATCVSCHGAHDVLSVRDPLSSVHKLNLPATCGRCHADTELMARYGKKADVLQLYRASVHGVALLQERKLSSPGCADCHGSHGAMPPHVDEVADVCGSCHSRVQEQFARSPHRKVVEQGGMEACTTCHGHHHEAPATAAMFLGSEAGHCGSCHSAPEDPGRLAAEALHGGITALQAELDQSERLLVEAAAQGVFIEDEQGYLDEVHSVLLRVRPLSHSAAQAEVAELLNRGHAMIQETLESLEVKSRWLRDRKIFTTFFAVVVGVFIGTLLIRRGEV
jgi:hypothetical protein